MVVPIVRTLDGEWYGKEKLWDTLMLKQLKISVDKSTVSQTLNLFLTTGSVSKRPYPKERAFRKLTDPAQLLIFRLCLSRPGIYLREIRDELLSVLEIDVNESAICKFLHKSGLTHQRLKVTAVQQDVFL